MPLDEQLTKTFHIRVAPSELVIVEKLQQRLQAQMPSHTTVTQRTVFLVALERLEAYLNKLEHDRDVRASKATRTAPQGDQDDTL